MRATSTLLVSLVLIAGGLVLILFGSRALNDANKRLGDLLTRTVVLSAQEPRYNQFLAAPSFGFEMDDQKHSSFYFFNLTNAQQVLQGQMPHVVQVGPYVYKRLTRKINVQFFTAPATSGSSRSTRQVRYQVQTTYFFVPERSNGTEHDRIVSINGSYARRIHQLQKVGMDERLLASEFAQNVLARYANHLRGDFLANLKQKALGHSLPQTFTKVVQQSLQSVLHRNQKRMDSSRLTSNLVQMFASTRTDMIPQVLADIYKDISDRFMPDIMTKTLATATKQALPRVLANTHQRLLVESGPFMLRQQFVHQKRQHVPMSLGSLKRNLPRIAFPYALKEVYDVACLEVLPSYLLTLKLEIIQQDMATNLVLADVAQHNVVTRWRKGRSRIDFDSFVDDQPLGMPRKGFELYPTLQSQELSEEVAYLLLGSAANKRFSIVDYPELVDGTSMASKMAVPLGFALWKQVIAMNETAISLLITGVNNDVALKSDFLTREQVLFVRQYLIKWSQSDLVQRDRERFWRQGGFALRSVHSQVEPAVDIDFELFGVQNGFELSTKASTISNDSAAILWNSSHAFSFLNVYHGFPLWVLAIQGDASSIQQIQTGVTGLTTAQIQVVVDWIKGLLANSFLWRRALRQWSQGSCVSVLQLSLDACLQYDLEPLIPGQQTGLEMNVASDSAIQLSTDSRDFLWDATNAYSFLNTQGYVAWLLAAKNVESFTALVTSLVQTSPTKLALENSLTLSAAVEAIVEWLMAWQDNPLNVLATTQWWHQSYCRERELISTGPATVTPTANKASCEPQTTETVVTSTLVKANGVSPFFKKEQTIEIHETTCTLDPNTNLYTQKDSVYQIQAIVYSCDCLDATLSLETSVATLPMSGFELGSIQPHQTQSLQLSSALASLLWDRSWKTSFLNEQGFQFWNQLSGTLSQNVLDDVTSDVVAACSKLVGGGSAATSGIFNETLVDTTACKSVTWNDLMNVRSWVLRASQTKWLQTGLLEQWRDGLSTQPVDNNVMDLEPYRDGVQTGWELWYGCRAEGCTLTTSNRTSCMIPMDAFRLWDESEPASFVTQSGFGMWQSLMASISLASSDSVLVEEIQNLTALRAATTNSAQSAAKLKIAQAMNLGKWQDWMDYVVLWLIQLQANEYVLRDVLGHWLHATCETEANFVELALIKDDNATSHVVDCQDQYQVTLDKSIGDLQVSVSRPTTFFDPNYMQQSALFVPTKQVQATEITTTCALDGSGPGLIKTVNTRISSKTATACNFLHVLSVDELQTNETALSLARSESNSVQPFELNAKGTDQTSIQGVSIDLALALWERHNAWSFTNLTSFLINWQPSMNDLTKLSTVNAGLTVFLQAAKDSISSASLEVFAKYLNDWEMSEVSTTRVAKAWIATKTDPILDLSDSLPGVQSGFEILRSPAWNDRTDVKPQDAVSLNQSQYLWNPANAYSFINTNPTAQKLYGLPIGFEAWKEIYNAIDYSSECLVEQFPLINALEHKLANESGVHRLSVNDQQALVKHMSQDTSLSELQLAIVAQYLFDWSWNIILQDYVVHQWAHGLTPRGQPDVFYDLSRSLYRFGVDPTTAPQVYGHDFFALAKTTEQRTVLAGVSPMSLRKLWSKTSPGSLLYPQSLVVWCAIDLYDAWLGTASACSHLLDEYGQVASPVIDQLTLALGKATQPLTRASNLTRLSLEYLSTTLEMELFEILSVATWLRQLPQSSSFFQAIQMQRWLVEPAKRCVDPLCFGYELSSVFLANESIPRNASNALLEPNRVLNGAFVSTQCNISTPTALLLWNSSRDLAFVNSKGFALWLAYAQSPAGEASRNAVLKGDLALKDSFSGKTSTEVSCTLEAVGHWIASWLRHPWTRQYIETKWFVATSKANVNNPGDLTSCFALGSFDKSASPALTTESTRKVWSLVSQVLWDQNEQVSLLHQDHGWPLWRATLSALCASSDAMTGNCLAPVSGSTVAASVALALLSQAIQTRVLALNDSDVGEFNSSTAQHMITSVVHPWMSQWLDSDTLVTFIAGFLPPNEAPTNTKDHAQAMQQLVAAQFVNATLSRINFSVGDQGVLSEKFAQQEMVFNATSRVVEPTNSSTPFGGFCELRSYCELSDQDIRFAYDLEADCGFGKDYSLVFDNALGLLQVLSDSQSFTWASINRTTTRGALVINALLSLPFHSQQECVAMLSVLPQAFGTANGHTGAELCLASNADNQIYADLSSVFPANLQSLTAGSTLQSIALLSDLKKYLTYVATKLVYEPQVLGIPVGSSHPEPDTTGFPLGGFLCASTPSEFLFMDPSDVTKHGLLANDSLGQGLPSFSFELPDAKQVSTFKNSLTAIGRLTAINNITNVPINGVSMNLLANRFTDGSQFTSDLFVAQNDSLVPSKLIFYWDFGQRLVRIDYSRQVTRFGIQLLRYNVSDWEAPTLYPSGISQMSSEVLKHLSLVNLSHVFDDELDICLSFPHFRSVGDVSTVSSSWQQTNLGVKNALQSPSVKLVATTTNGATDSAHESVVDVDPTTGSVLNRRLSWQLNLPKVTSGPMSVWHFNLSSIALLPLVEIKEQSSISPQSAFEWVHLVNSGPFASEKVAIWQVVGGGIYIALALVLVVWHLVRRRQLSKRQATSQRVTPAEVMASETARKSSPMPHGDDDNVDTTTAKWNVMRAVEQTDQLKHS